MADYSVKAVLTASASGFVKGFQTASSAVDSLRDKVSSSMKNIGTGILQGVGQKVADVAMGTFQDITSGLNESSAAWQTFEGNMKSFGKEADIPSVKKELKQFAAASIYSASDMASTYSQLAAVGTKNTTQLVKGFGGLAAASANPVQAMKTLSTQATQAAAKPTLQWMDFKLMLEQTPAGMQAVAEQMHKSGKLAEGDVQHLITAVQDEQVATQDFFDAIAAAGGDGTSFSQMATQYHTVQQAMDGLAETATGVLQPAYDAASQVIIDALTKINDRIAGMNVDDLADKVASATKAAIDFLSQFIGKAVEVGKGLWKAFGPYIKTLINAFKIIGQSAFRAFGAVADAMGKANGRTETAQSGFKAFQTVVEKITAAFVRLSGFIQKNADVIAKLVSYLPLIIAGFVGLKVIGSITSLFGAAKGAGSGFAGTLVALGQAATMLASAFLVMTLTAKMLAAAGTETQVMFGIMAGVLVALVALVGVFGENIGKAAPGLAALGAAVLMVAAGFALMAQAAIAVSGAGTGAIAIFIAMEAGLVALVAVIGVFGAGITAAAPGLLALGAAALMAGTGFALVGVGALLAAKALAQVTALLPMVVAYGVKGAASIAVLSAALLAFGLGATAAGAGAVILGAGLIVAGAGIAVAAGASLLLAGALKLVAKQMTTIADTSETAASNLAGMETSVSIVQAGLSTLGGVIKSAMTKLASAFKDATADAKTEANNLARGYVTGLTSGLAPVPSIAARASVSGASMLMAGAPIAYAAGLNISQGFANGMMARLGTIQAAASQMVSAANAAIVAKAKIGSPSRVTAKYGKWFGEGWVNGIESMLKDSRDASGSLVSLPNVSPGGTNISAAALAGGAYYGGAVRISVPLAIDGREFARAMADYTRSEMTRTDNHTRRRSGLR